MPRSIPRQRVYDHRIRQLVWETGDPHLFPELHIPRSTLAGWLKDPPPEVVITDCLVTNDLSLALRVKKLERGWRRPRKRIHPARPKLGIRAAAPNAIWHIDSTIIRLLDGTKLYLQGIIDNFSRRILCWSLKEKLEPKVTTCELLREAAAFLSPGAAPPQLMVDGGIENLNESVDNLISDGLVRRVVAQVDLRESNSMIERWWRSLKHNWLFLNVLDTPTTVRRLVAFYVQQHNQVMPHWSHKSLTPDEVYFGTSDGIGEHLKVEHARARKARLKVNQGVTCETCEASGPGDTGKMEPVAGQAG